MLITGLTCYTNGITKTSCNKISWLLEFGKQYLFWM